MFLLRNSQQITTVGNTDLGKNVLCKFGVGEYRTAFLNQISMRGDESNTHSQQPSEKKACFFAVLFEFEVTLMMWFVEIGKWTQFFGLRIPEQRETLRAFQTFREDPEIAVMLLDTTTAVIYQHSYTSCQHAPWFYTLYKACHCITWTGFVPIVMFTVIYLLHVTLFLLHWVLLRLPLY